MSGLLSVVVRKMKEISVRKVLSATIWDVGRLINHEFLWPILTAIIIGPALATFLLFCLTEWAFRIDAKSGSENVILNPRENKINQSRITKE